MKTVLFAINYLGYNGAPLFAFSIAKILRKNGFHVHIWSYYDGELHHNFEKNGISVELVNPRIIKRTDIEQKAREYDCLIAFTITTYQIVQYCCNIVPTIWYIHEGHNLEEYLKEYNCKRIFLQKHRIWVVSEYTQQYIFEIWKKETEVIHNFVPDVFEKYQTIENSPHKKIRFLLLGNMIERKAFDVFFNAFLLLDEVDKRKCELHYAGDIPDTEYAHDLTKKIEQYHNVIYHGIILDEKIYELYHDCDVVVIPSRDESCSLVALEAAMMAMPCIISENVGARYMIDSESGWVVRTGDSKSLSWVFHDIIAGKYDLISMGTHARKNYLNYATETIYEDILLKKLYSILSFNRMRWNLVHRIKHVLQKHRDLLEESPFKLLEIPKKSKIVLYGAGKNGQYWKEKLEKTRYCKVVAWVDKKADGKALIHPDLILKIKFDYILISVKNREAQKEIKKELINKRIPEYKIKILEE